MSNLPRSPSIIRINQWSSATVDGMNLPLTSAMKHDTYKSMDQPMVICWATRPVVWTFEAYFSGIHVVLILFNARFQTTTQTKHRTAASSNEHWQLHNLEISCSVWPSHTICRFFHHTSVIWPNSTANMLRIKPGWSTSAIHPKTKHLEKHSL